MLRSERPFAIPSGVLAGAGRALSLATLVVYPLKQVSPVLSLGVLYVLPVVVVSMFWGLVVRHRHEHRQRGGLQLLSPASWDLRVGRRPRVGGARPFVVVAAATGLLAELARARGREAEQRRQEADLSAEIARLLLDSDDLDSALELAATAIGRRRGR